MLEVKNITAGYGRITVLDGASVSFEKGKLTSVIGVNGSGKSTLLKSMLGIIPLSSGEVLVDGEDISSLKRNELARRISYLSQGKNTPDMSVFQLVLHGRFPYLSYPRHYTKLDKDIAYSAIERVGLSSLADKPLRSLSGGMRQNAYIAMALAQDTDYILLDEPTAYLDISHQLALMNTLRDLTNSGKGIVTVLHDLPLAFDFSDYIAVLHSGKVLHCGRPQEICTLPAIKSIFGVEIKWLENEKKHIYTL